MISIVIPTMWKSEMIHKTIESFSKFNLLSELKSELIIIDNTNSDYCSDSEFIRVIKMEENIYVNPAWNLGVSLANYDHVCLLNDDIFINMVAFLNNFKNIVYEPNLDYGIIAINPEGFNFSEIVNNDNDLFTLDSIRTRGSGFGMMMILKRNKYFVIPKRFKIFFGDDIFWFINNDILKNKNYSFKGMNVMGNFSVTSSLYEENFMQKEHAYWDETIQEIIKFYEHI